MALVTRKRSRKPRAIAQVTHDGAGLHCPECGASEPLVATDRETALRQIARFHREHEACLRPILDQARAVLFRRPIERSAH
jgi:hypothetical protein